MKGAATKEQAQHHHRPNPHHHHQVESKFRKGSTVEVTSDEEGFRGAWFVATLLKPPSNTSSLKPSSKKKNPNYHKAYIEYQTLISDFDPSVRLREHVDAKFVRPVPPQESHPKPFELGDIVDAYYSDGWWTGVITRLLQDSRFLVTFQNPPDEIEFGLSDLRFHREWVNGNWLRPVNQKAAEVMFSVGKKVEISFEGEGHQESWFPATILEENGKGIFKTQFQIQDSSGQAGHAIVDSGHIRPSPPHLKHKNFFLLEKVDAFHDGGWRSGVITKELADSRYIVFFRQSNKDREFNHSELRPHMEWKDGKWFTASQDVLIPSDDQNHEGGNLVGQPSPCNEQPSGVAPVVPSDFVGKEKSTKEIPATVPSPTASPVSMITIEVPSEEKISDVVNPKSEGNNFTKQSLGGDQSSDSHSWGKRVKRKRMKFGELDNSSMFGEKKPTDGFTEVPVEKALTSIQGLTCDMVRSPSTQRSCQSNAQDSSKHTGYWAGLDDKELHSVKVVDQFELGEKTQKRRRGRPSKSAVKSSIPSVPEEANKSALIEEFLENDSLEVVEVTSMNTVGFSQECVTNGSGKKLMNSQIKQKHKTGVMSTSPPIMPNEEYLIRRQPERQAQKRGRKRMINLNTVSQVLDSSNATEWKQADSNSVRKDLEMVTKESDNIMSDDQPLSKWFEEMHAPATHDGLSKGVSPPRNVDQCGEESSEQPEIIKAAVDNKNGTAGSELQCLPAVDNKNGTSGSELECLPFVKNTVLWSTIESMEVFRKMPQKPHFHPIEQCKESSREGLAIGFMVTFSSVVERSSRLQFDDPKVTMNEILETLVELESHGFDVQAVRDRVTALLSGKEKQENLENEIEQLDSEIGKHNEEKTKIDEEIDEINRQIKDLQGKLSEVKSRKENKDCEIAALQSKMEGVKESIKSIRCDFEGLATLF